tara:strand:+ start:304 stop:495 length:192 start_codon:yes stop_codon:yes gene_type:complete
MKSIKPGSLINICYIVSSTEVNDICLVTAIVGHHHVEVLRKGSVECWDIKDIENMNRDTKNND